VFNDQGSIRNQDLVAGLGSVTYGEPFKWVGPRRFFLGARLVF
jgi:hypothetical protein